MCITPFGAPIAALSFDDPLMGTNRYKRKGKEYIDDFDWNKYDFGARTFDSWTLRALQIDPLAEKYYPTSPYAIWNNNPVRFIDPSGRQTKDPQKEEYSPKRAKLERAAPHMQKSTKALNRTFKGSKIGIQGKAYGAEAGFQAGNAGGKVGLKLGIAEGKLSTNGLSVEGTAAEFSMSLNGGDVVEISTNISLGKCTIAEEGIEATWGSASGNAKVGNTNTAYGSIDDNNKFSIGAAFSVFKAKLAVDFDALETWISETAKAIIELASPIVPPPPPPPPPADDDKYKP